MRWLAIINPRSGHRKHERDIEALEAGLREAVPEGLEVIVTSSIGQALSLARRRRDVDGFVSVGGDGTLFDVINGMDVERQILAVIPAGTGNGLARDLGLLDGNDALAALVGGATRNIDLVKVAGTFVGGEGRAWYVATTASLGYTSDVVDLANSYFKPLGHLCYPVASLLQAMLARPFHGRWRTDGGDWQALDATNIIVNNTAYAGDFEAFPGAVIDDGRANACVARAGFFGQVVHNVSVLSRRHFYVTGPLFGTSDLEFELDDERLLMLDGEIVPGIVGARFTVLPGQLRVVTGSSAA